MHITALDSIAQRYDHVYVSPHLDDVALSCGGRIVEQRRRGETVLVVTVFTGDIDQYRKPSGPAVDAFTNTQERLAEDRQAMMRLDADYLWLDYKEVLYRHRDRYPGLGLFFRRVAVERELCEALLGDLSRICAASGGRTLYLPLGAGQHLDHRILFEVGTRLQEARRGEIDVCFYEDVPYVLFHRTLAFRFKLVGVEVRRIRAAPDLTRKKGFWQEVSELVEAARRLSADQAWNRALTMILSLLFVLSSLVMIYVPRLPKGAWRGRGAVPEIVDVSAAFQQKMAAIDEYRSQLDALFLSGMTAREALREYSRRIGANPDQYLERFWRSS